MRWLDELNATKGDADWYCEVLQLKEDIICIPRKEFDRLIAIVEGAEWAGNEIYHECPICRSMKAGGHEQGCPYSDSWEGGE